MISSMTGFGRSEISENGITVSVEMRSLNHRFLDVEVRVPKSFNGNEQELKERIKKSIRRGRVNTIITIKGDVFEEAPLSVDTKLAAMYIRMLTELKDEFKLDGKITLEQLLNMPDVISYESSEPLNDEVWTTVLKATDLALHDLLSMRDREGIEIKKDLMARLASINGIVLNIEKRSKEKSQEVLTSLKEKVKAITDTETINEERIETEIALLVEKMDVTEECIRFKSHNILFEELMDKEESEGRKLNFLLQEMHREANTIGAKASDAQIAHWVVDIKDEVEKLREQVQNIE